MKFSCRSILLLAAAILSVWVPRLAAFEIKLFPAAQVYDPDTEMLHERLGIKGQDLKVEDFEDAKLEDWLRTNLEGGGGEGTDRTAWAGNLASASTDSARLEIHLRNVRFLGIGLSDNDGGNERVSINGNPPVQLKTLPGHDVDSRTRAYYVMIEAESGDPDIRSVAFDQCFTVHFDHLVVLEQKVPQREERLLSRLLLDLIDGTRLVAYPAGTSIPISVRGERLELPFDRISTMHLQKGTNTATILLKNGEKITAELWFSELRLTTILGDVSISREKIRHLKVSVRGEFKPARESTSPAKAAYHTDEPSFEGKSLRWWLQQSGPQMRAGKMQDLLAPDADAEMMEQQAANEAIRKMGSAAVPFLVEMLRRGDAHHAVRGFAALGDLAKGALHDLILLLDESEETIHACTIWAIGHIGPAAESAIPILLEEFRTGYLPAAEALGNIGPASAEAVPIIIAKLKPGDQPYDIPLVIALGKIGGKDAVPVLAEIALGNDSRRRPEERGFVADLRKHRAVEALGNIGPKASAAVPALVQLLKHQEFGNLTGLYFMEKIIRTLGSIGPQAGEAVSVLREIADRQNQSSALQLRITQAAKAALAKIQVGRLK